MFVHPLGMPNLREHYMTNVVGNPMDTAIAAAHLVLSGTMEECPRLRVLLSHGLPTPRFLVLDKDADAAQLRRAADELGLPLMLKAPHEGSTIGISKVESADGSREPLDWLISPGVRGRGKGG